jgi:peptide chain release factor 1
MILDKYDLIKSRFNDVERELSNADAMKDMQRFAQLNREYKELQKIVGKFNELQNVLSNLDHSKDVLRNEKDEEFKDMARMELEELEKKKNALEEEIKLLLIPRDPEDEKKCYR